MVVVLKDGYCPLSGTFNSIVSGSLIFTYQKYDSDSSLALLCRWGGLVHLSMDSEYCYWPSDWLKFNSKWSVLVLLFVLMCITFDGEKSESNVKEGMVDYNGVITCIMKKDRNFLKINLRKINNVSVSVWILEIL